MVLPAARQGGGPVDAALAALQLAGVAPVALLPADAALVVLQPVDVAPAAFEHLPGGLR